MNEQDYCRCCEATTRSGSQCTNAGGPTGRCLKHAEKRPANETTRSTRSLTIDGPDVRDEYATLSHAERDALVERNRRVLASRGDVEALRAYNESLSLT